jgi:hypothetical protein
MIEANAAKRKRNDNWMLLIDVSNVDPWDGLTESQRFDLRFKGTMTGCPECGLKHLLGPCYGGFHPDDDFGSAPGGG